MSDDGLITATNGAITTDMASSTTGSFKTLGFTNLWFEGRQPKNLPDSFITWIMPVGGNRPLTGDDARGKVRLLFKVCSRSPENALAGVLRLRDVIVGTSDDPIGGVAWSSGLREDDGDWYHPEPQGPSFIEHSHIIMNCVFVQEDFRPRT